MYLPWMQCCNKWKDQKYAPLCQHVCRHTWVWEAKPRGEVTCSGACSVHEAAEEEAESHPGAGKGKQELRGSMAASAAGPGRGDSLLLVSPASHGCWNNEGVGCAPPCWTYLCYHPGWASHSCPSERAHGALWNTVSSGGNIILFLGVCGS